MVGKEQRKVRVKVLASSLKVDEGRKYCFKVEFIGDVQKSLVKKLFMHHYLSC